MEKLSIGEVARRTGVRAIVAGMACGCVHIEDCMLEPDIAQP